MKPGSKVHFVPKPGEFVQRTANGIVKSTADTHVHVVWYCSQDWGNYEKYDSMPMAHENVALGWVKETVN